MRAALTPAVVTPRRPIKGSGYRPPMAIRGTTDRAQDFKMLFISLPSSPFDRGGCPAYIPGEPILDTALLPGG